MFKKHKNTYKHKKDIIKYFQKTLKHLKKKNHLKNIKKI